MNNKERLEKKARVKCFIAWCKKPGSKKNLELFDYIRQQKERDISCKADGDLFEAKTTRLSYLNKFERNYMLRLIEDQEVRRMNFEETKNPFGYTKQ